jgi:hypothetical protein
MPKPASTARIPGTTSTARLLVVATLPTSGAPHITNTHRIFWTPPRATAAYYRACIIYTYATHAFSIALLHPHCLLDGRTRFVSSCPSCLFRGGFAYPLTLLQIRAVFCI